MSPSEFDLRSALRDGDDEPLDVNAIIAGGRAVAARRRTNLITAVVAAAFIGVASTTGIVLANQGDGGTRTTATNDLARAPEAQKLDGNAGGAAPTTQSSSLRGTSGSTIGRDLVPPAAGGSVGAPECPSALPVIPVPSAPSDDPLIGPETRAIVICAYGSALEARVGGGAPGRTVLSGPAALDLQVSLESASRTSTSQQCPSVPPNGRREFAFFAVDQFGQARGPITATLTANPCNVTVTDGRAVRYDWTPSSGLLGRLLRLERAAPPTESLPRPSPSGRKFGSPVR